MPELPGNNVITLSDYHPVKVNLLDGGTVTVELNQPVEFINENKGNLIKTHNFLAPLIAKVLLKPLAFTGFVASILVAAKPAAALNSFQQISPTPTTYQEGVDFNVATNPTVFDNVTASLSNVSNLGCNASDFSSFTSGNIALIMRGTCIFSVKVLNAQNAGAIGAILYNNTTGIFAPSLSGAAISIPTIATTQSLGQSLLATSNATVQINIAPTPVPFKFESSTGLVILGAWFGVSKLRNTLARISHKRKK